MEQHTEQPIQNNKALLVLAIRGTVWFSSWLFWGLFLLVPTVTGIHGTQFMDDLNNVVFMMIGLTLCTAQNTANAQGDFGKMLLFYVCLILLSWWF